MKTERLIEVLRGALLRAELAGADESEVIGLREAIACAADLERSRRAWAAKALETEERREWLDPEAELPPSSDELVLVCVSGVPRENLTMDHAYELASYSGDDGWILEQYPEWAGAAVHAWMPLPEMPKEGKNDG